MYRILNMSGSIYAVELFADGRDAQDEMDEMDEIQSFIEEGCPVSIVEDYTEVEGARLIIRD